MKDNKSSLSIIVLVKNEEKNILNCLESLPQADEILIIDDYSTDRTLEVVENLKMPGIKIFQHHLDSDFSNQRNFGLKKAKSEWVLFVDADEEITKELADEVKQVCQSSIASINSYKIRRADKIFSRILKHGETGNIRLVRLAKKNAGIWQGNVHEVWNTKGDAGNLSGILLHFPHQTISDFLREIDFYSTLRAKELFNKKVKGSLLDIVFYPKAKFLLNYLVKFGFLDGVPGLVLAIMMSLHSFLVRGKLWLLTNKI